METKDDYGRLNYNESNQNNYNDSNYNKDRINSDNSLERMNNNNLNINVIEEKNNSNEKLLKKENQNDDIEGSETVEKYNANRKWYQNVFSKVQPGSIRASIFSLSILSIGTGCLSLPQRFGQLSVLLCSILVVLAGFAAYWTLDLLIYASLKSGETTYSKVIAKICGPRWAKFLDITMIIYIYGVLIIYQIISKLKIIQY